MSSDVVKKSLAFLIFAAFVAALGVTVFTRRMRHVMRTAHTASFLSNPQLQASWRTISCAAFPLRLRIRLHRRVCWHLFVSGLRHPAALRLAVEGSLSHNIDS